MGPDFDSIAIEIKLNCVCGIEVSARQVPGQIRDNVGRVATGIEEVND